MLLGVAFSADYPYIIYMINLTDETKNQERIEVLRNNFVEGAFPKTNAGLHEAFALVEDLKDCFGDKDDIYDVFLYDPITNWATDLSLDVSYSDWD